jgi:two-component sensor histidine kinase/PAS domain-containing protein
MQEKTLRDRFTAISDAWTLAQGIVDTVREPVLVLDKDLRVITASRSFYSGFKVSPQDTEGRLLYALGDGQWDIPKLRVLLENIIPDKGVMEGYEVEHEFPDLGQRTMCLNARQVFYEGGANTTILLGIEDVTAQRVLEREKDELLRQFEESRAFAQAIVDTVREPFLVLDQDLRVLAASRSFYSAFKVSPDDTQGRLLYALGDRQWDIPGLRLLLEKIVPERGVMEDYEVEHEFPDIGQRTMLLNARKVFYEGGSHTTILLGIEDVTAQRTLGREKDALLREFDEARAFAQAIVDTVREPFLVLDQDLRVLAASRSFYSAFKVSPDATQGRLLYALGDGQWDIPKLHLLLEKIVPEHGVMEGYEVEHEFPGLGHRTMLLNARKVFYEGGSHTTILLGIEDITERRILEQEKEELLQQKEVLLEELQHRVANSLQIIASILLMKARTVQSEETRLHLQDAHKRVMSIAAVQKQLHVSGANGSIEIRPYLARLCETLAVSMIGDSRPISLRVVGEGGHATSRQAESLGLIVTELVMNALKHAFPDEKVEGQITVAYDMVGTNWKLSVSDNGIGKPDGVFAQGKSGLGTGIVKALSHQLEAQFATVAGPAGTTVSITHATFPAKAARTAQMA